MPFSGTGVYSAPSSSWNPAVAATTIDATDWIALLADISSALSLCITKDGQQTTTGTIPFATAVTMAQTLAVTGNVTFAGTLAVTGATALTGALTCASGAAISSTFTIVNTNSPASGAAGTAGSVTWDASYLYVCTASGAWKRLLLQGGY